MDMGNIWRLNTKTDGIKNYGQEGLLDFCKKEKIVGIGWSDPIFTTGLSSEIKEAVKLKEYIWNFHKKENRKTKSFSTASNVIVDRMKIGDYVWTRSNGIYWIAKVIGESKYMRNNTVYQDYDIGFYRNVEYFYKGLNISEVPGKIISSFASRSTIQKYIR